MFLLIRLAAKIGSMLRSNLHSTMFLLIQSGLPELSSNENDLHSTMFLLIPFRTVKFSDFSS